MVEKLNQIKSVYLRVYISIHRVQNIDCSCISTFKQDWTEFKTFCLRSTWKLGSKSRSTILWSMLAHRRFRGSSEKYLRVFGSTKDGCFTCHSDFILGDQLRKLTKSSPRSVLLLYRYLIYMWIKRNEKCRIVHKQVYMRIWLYIKMFMKTPVLK